MMQYMLAYWAYLLEREGDMRVEQRGDALAALEVGISRRGHRFGAGQQAGEQEPRNQDHC
jgi:hypothetical protein